MQVNFLQQLHFLASKVSQLLRNYLHCHLSLLKLAFEYLNALGVFGLEDLCLIKADFAIGLCLGLLLLSLGFHGSILLNLLIECLLFLFFLILC